MKKSLAAALALVALVVASVVAAGAVAAPERSSAGALVGTGATFPFPLISKWIPAVGSSLGINITYTPTGSGAGIAQITARTVDFGASDAPLSDDQLAACKGCTVIPWALAAESIPYNLPGLNGRLRLSGQLIANIYLGKITNWNDPAIKQLNPNLNLPDLKITPVYRSDGSGTTYAFTDYLSAVSPEWKSKVGRNTSVNFPAGVGARGSSGTAGVVKQTDGALTYVDAAYSIQNKLQFALIRNRAGKFTTPGLRGVTQAVSKLPARITNLGQLKIVDPPASAGPAAYPITTFTYVIVPLNSGEKAADLRKFVYWAVTQGQKFGPPLWFVPLPKPVQAFAYREIKKIQSRGA
jgi:phosphate transport system substrate-binding protein